MRMNSEDRQLILFSPLVPSSGSLKKRPASFHVISETCMHLQGSSDSESESPKRRKPRIKKKE